MVINELINLKLMDENKTIQDISHELDVPVSTIYGKIRRGVVFNNFKRRGRYTTNIDNFKNINSKSLYWIGFLAADGTILKDSLELRLNIKDANHIDKFASFISPQSKITFNENTNSIGFRVHDVELISILNSYGLVNNKSLIYKPDFRLINSRDYWRGIFDGDGSIAKEKIGNVSIKFNGTYDLMVACNNYLLSLNLNGVTSKTPTQNGNIFRISYSCRPAISILRHLYKDSDVYLERKFNLFAKYDKRYTQDG